MMQQSEAPALADRFLQDVLDGLRSTPKRLHCKYFYDATGSRLFEQICELPEYYLTRAELEVMNQSAGEMSNWLGPQIRLIEFGSGSSLKTRILLDALHDPSIYIPVDISRRHLLAVSSQLAADYPGLEVLPLLADYSAPLVLPESSASFRRTIAYFPGSTIGNMNDAEARLFLVAVRELVGEGGALLIGMDLVKDPAILKAAYDDAAGLTAAFNLNLLERMRSQLGADVEPADFAHEVRYNSDRQRIELYLRSNRAQGISVGGTTVELGEGELIHTENCHKYTIRKALELAALSGFLLRTNWQDPNDYFSVQYWQADSGETDSPGQTN